MSRARDISKLLEETEGEEELFTFPTVPEQMYPFDASGAKLSLNRKLVTLGIQGIQIEEIEADEENNVVVTFSDFENNVLDVVFSYDEDGASAIIVGDDKDQDDEENIVVDLDPLGVPVVSTPFGFYINLLVLDWLSKSTLETIFIAGALLEPKASHSHYAKDAFGNLLVAPVESYEFDLEKIEIDSKMSEGAIDEVIYKIVVRGGKKERRPLVRRLRKKRLSPKQRAGLRKASRTRKSAKSKMKRKLSLKVRKRLHLKPQKMRKGMRVG